MDVSHFIVTLFMFSLKLRSYVCIWTLIRYSWINYMDRCITK